MSAARNRVDAARMRWLADHVLPHEPALRAWLSRRLHGRLGVRIEVDDVIQETYATLARLDDVGHVRNPRAYLFTVAQSLVLQHVRRASIVSIEVVAEVDALDASHDHRSPDRHAMARQELHRVGMLIAALPARCRQAFVLRKVHGLTQREIAKRMRISESTVEKHIGKGVRLLAAAMADAACGGDTEKEPAGAGSGHGKASR